MTLSDLYAGGLLNRLTVVAVDVVVFKDILIDVSAVCLLYHSLIEGNAEETVASV